MKSRSTLTVNIDSALQEKFELTCKVAGLKRAEVIEALIQWFLTKEEDL